MSFKANIALLLHAVPAMCGNNSRPAAIGDNKKGKERLESAAEELWKTALIKRPAV